MWETRKEKRKFWKKGPEKDGERQRKRRMKKGDWMGEAE